MRTAKQLPALKRVRQLFDYDAASGRLTRRISVSPNARAGDIAGHASRRGYRTVSVDGVAIYEHRLVWFYVHGVWPSEVIDHKNRNKADNRLSNLRDVSQKVNTSRATTPRNTNVSGWLGVSRCAQAKTAPWRASITVHGKRRHLGYFDSPERAHEAYRDAQQSISQNGEMS